VKASRSVDRRVERVRRSMDSQELAALIAFAPADCRYLTGFTGEAAAVVVTRNDLALVSDSRFTVQAAEEVPHTRLLLSDNGSDDVLIDFLLQSPAMCDQSQTIGIESGHLTVKRWERLRQQLDEKNFGWRLVDGLVEQARRIKFADELEAMRAAGALTASVMTHLESIPVVGRTERDIALELELYLRRRGSEGIAFTFIVAAGPRGAMPHGEASDAVIPPDALLVVDLGSVVDGYASDLTRTYATGDVTEELRAAYEAVMVAQAEAVAAVRAGIACRDVDKVARDRLASAGLADLFVHSLGHGVGLEIHEGPSLSSRSDDVLEAGMVVTVEPGVYLPGRGGVRIEDSVLVTSEGAEILTECPRELRRLR